MLSSKSKLKPGTSSRSKNTAFVDLDGVIVDFVNAVFRLNNTDPKILEKFKGDYEITKHLNITASDFWGRIESEPNFWHDLEKTDEADNIINYLEDTFDPKNIYFLSSPSQCPLSHYGKAHWIKTHYPRYISRLILTGHKHFLAGRDRILIDDSDTNINRFKAAGGRTVLVPRPWNSRHSVPKGNVMLEVLRDLRRVQ